MKTILLYSILFIFPLSAMAQVELPKKPLKIKAVDTKKVLPENTSSLNILNKKEKTLKILKEKKVDNRPYKLKKKFKNPEENFNAKLTRKERNYKIDPKFYKDQNLGTFTSNGNAVQFSCRDHKDEDGDRVRILVNDIEIEANILLLNKSKHFSIPLQKGFNKIDIEALNQGLGGPNTAAFKVFDDSGNLISKNIWNLTTGVKATMIIVKE